jgi:hypothetical protein
VARDCHHQMICYAEAHDHLPDLLRLIAVGYIAWPRNAALSLLPRNRGNDDVKEQTVDKIPYHWL